MLALDELEENLGSKLYSYLLREYKSDFVLDLGMEDAVAFAVEAYEVKVEDRFHALWLQLYTSPYTKVPYYTEFKEEIMGANKESKEKKNKINGKELGTLKGADLTQVKR